MGLHRVDLVFFECGRYIDSLQLTIGDVISPLWIGVILVAANPSACCRHEVEIRECGELFWEPTFQAIKFAENILSHRQIQFRRLGWIELRPWISPFS